MLDGQVFDSSVQREANLQYLGVNQVIAGWVEAFAINARGAKWRLFIPYRWLMEKGCWSILFLLLLVDFDVELLKVIK